jgi:4-aminobutyrate aminotransferase / (S)-3-amino-2-methylpropionate transaminase / 5-aminovalerate transaminase
VIDDEGLLERSQAIGEVIRARMCSWQQRWPAIGDVRGLGAMLAIELVADPATKKPSKELAQRVTAEALQRGLLLITCGVQGNGIRVLVPLVIGDAELEEALGAWEESLEAVLG